ncbi:MAG: DUF1573 domain-containing protein [Bacteroidaceae bacterium]|nr:DUF1573 domain-containing protein [Bacteroidaceae bacterium]
MTDLFRYIYLVSFLLLFSCQESEENKLSRFVKEWEGKEIVFPQDCSFSGLDGKECPSPPLDTPFKIVYYVDSLGCMSCKLKLEEWKRFIHEVDSLSDEKVSSFFYFHPKENDLKEVEILMKSNAFDYPVCIDRADRFNAANRFPENDSFHVFLLDEQNKVRVIGNPVLNPTLKELYLQVITGKKEDMTTPDPTRASVSDSLLELGTLRLGTPVKRSVGISNIGRNALLIKDVITSCDCVRATPSSEAVNPGESAEIQIEFTPEEAGEFFKDVYIYCNAEDSPVCVQIHGNVEK